MVAHNCKHEKEIGKYFEMVERHEHVLMDNGQPGIITVVTELKHSIDNLITLIERTEKSEEMMRQDISGIKTALTGIEIANIDLQKWQSDHDRNKDKDEKDKKDKADLKIRRQNLGLYFVLVVFTVINIVANLFLK